MGYKRSSGKKSSRSTAKVLVGTGADTANVKSKGSGRLYEADESRLGASKSGRLLATIKRDMDLKNALFQRRRRNEEVLSLAYCDGTMIGGGDQVQNLREYSTNLPYRYARWFESQLISKQMVVKVNRDAGEGQRPGGPADRDTGMWVATTLKRAAYEAGFTREIAAVGAEVLPRGSSVMAIGYHEEVISLAQSREVGKDAQSVVPEVLGEGDLEAKPGQAHSEISQGLATMASDPMVQLAAGSEGVQALLARKDSHDEAEYREETTDIPRESTRLIRRKVWMRKKRVGEEFGWAPWVYDLADSPIQWDRHISTVAEVKAAPHLFSESFRSKVQGYDGRDVSGVFSGGRMPSSDRMGSDAKQAQSENVLEDDERIVEWFAVWIRCPDMKSGGIRKIVCAEFPDEFVEADDNNPHVDAEGFGLIPGFFPFYDFTPIKSSLTVPETTCGIPPIAVGMPQFEQMTELNRLLRESALRHSLRFYDVHPAHKDNKTLLNALKDGTDGYAQVMKQEQIGADGKPVPSVWPIQFSGNTLDIERLRSLIESDWVKVMGMPPAVLQGVGTANTLGQDQQGIAAGERESGALVGYFERRVADMLSGLRGLIRGNYDDEDFIALLGTEGAAVMKAWQTGTEDYGDDIHVTFGANAQAQEAVERKQLMEAITLLKSIVEPMTGLEVYDTSEPIEELHRRLDLGPPKQNANVVRRLQEIILLMSTKLKALTGGAEAGSSPPNGGSAPRGGPNPSEGSAPQEGTLAAGAARGTVEPVIGK